ncbi:hypothetical protein PHYSODRAFT_329049 [Phytophthora sojae]|uniref:Uncharacterized protein n=1 Tax=Phytophthora sojae (strain P6497) TaxID=1094619 RepID=G4Z6U8_PHYSP|nr:hypothetical protein PHYSODRAFT_329049 [Phytophthora sojae]EGZ21004.1 hypothetical protein PHYSODRAFT_329049 [Phytophthora sojae]|eukprot:XP_009523721.1 hypothetical protein PHYSODRAFT_329049 [Phytophthora sojae]
MAPPSTKVFRESHALRYGLRVVGRDEVTGAVTCVVCLFCRHFGREERPGKKRKTPSTVKYFRCNFRTDLYLQHVLLQHPSRWERYKQCSDEDKGAFFPTDVTRLETDQETFVSSAEAAAAAKHSPLERHCWFLIPKRIVDLVQPPAAAWGGRHWQPPSFRVCEVVEQSVNGKRGAFYRVALFRRAELDVAVDSLATGLSVQQAARHLAALEKRTTGENCAATSFPCVKEGEMRDLARLAVSASLQVVSQLLAGTWGFGLVLREVTAAPTLPGAGYLDVRVVVYAQGELRDIHVIALPQLERRTAFELAQTIETVLDAVFPLWRTRVLGISHDGHPGTGGRNDPPPPPAAVDDRAAFVLPSMSTSRHRTAEVLSLLKTSISNSTPTISNRVLYTTWGACRQVSLALSSFYESLLGGSFLAVLRTVIAYVRQNPELLQEMGQPPSVAVDLENIGECNDESVDLNGNVDWLSMGLDTQWITDKRVRLRKHLAGLSSSSTAAATVDDGWWVAFFVVHWVATRANDAFDELRLPRISRARQADIISEILVELFATFNIQKGEQPEGEGQRYFSPQGKFSVLKTSVHDFLGDQGIFVSNVAEGLGSTALDKVLENIATCVLSLAESLSDLSATPPAEGEDVTSEEFELPPVLPQDLARLSGREFSELVKRHVGQLRLSLSEEELDTLEREYEAFHREANRDTELKRALAQCHKESPFARAWALAKGRFPLLQAYAGGLASTYAARDVVCSISMVGLSLGGSATEEDELRLAATDFGLEVALHTRQFNALADLSHSDAESSEPASSA